MPSPPSHRSRLLGRGGEGFNKEENLAKKKKVKQATISRLIAAIDKINAAAGDPALRKGTDLQQAARLVYKVLERAESDNAAAH